MKKYFLTGLIILLPVALTLMLIEFLFDFLTDPFVALVEPLVSLIRKNLPFLLPNGATLFLAKILSLVFLSLAILFLGFITQVLIANVVAEWFHNTINRIPFVKTVYKASRDVFSALFSSDDKKAFKYPVIAPFPYAPSTSLGFVAGEVAQEVQKKIQTPLTSVFIPNSPHPISGFLVLVPTEQISIPQITNEEMVKYLVSCGTILPESDKKDFDDDF